MRTDDIVVMEMDSDGKEKLEAGKKRKATSVIRNPPGKRARNIESTRKKGILLRFTRESHVDSIFLVRLPHFTFYCSNSSFHCKK